MSETFVTKMNNRFVLQNNPDGCEIRFVSDVPDKYKTVQIKCIDPKHGVCKEEVAEMIYAYTNGTLMHQAFKKLIDDHRELIVHGPQMLEIFDNMGKEK